MRSRRASTATLLMAMLAASTGASGAATTTRPAAPPATPASAPAAAKPSAPYLRVVEEKNKSVELQIATRTFAPAAGAKGPKVALVGVAHIGDKSFYDGVQKLLEGYDVVLFESVKPPGTGGAGGDTPKRRIDSTKAAMQFIGSMIETERAKAAAYPKDAEALIEFARQADPRLERFVRTALVDAWGHQLVYEFKADQTGQAGGIGGYALTSLGADGASGGEGENADIAIADLKAPEALALSKDDGLQTQLADALGLKFQLTALDYGLPNWRCSDMAVDEVQRRLEAKGLDFDLIGGTLAGSSLPAKLVKVMLGLMKFADSFLEGAIADTFKVVMIEMLGDPTLIDQSLDQLGQGFGEVIVKDRNQVPLDDLRAIVAAEPKIKSVAILYGAAHMDSMEASLQSQLGYEPSGEPQWLSAIRVDLTQSKVRQQDLNQIRAMMKQMTAQMKAQRRVR